MNGQGQQAGASNWLLGAFKQNPEGLLLLAAGCALLLRQTSAGRNAGSSRGASAASFDTSGVRRTAEGARDYVESARQYVDSATQGATQYAHDVAQQTRGAVGEYTDAAVAYAGQLRETVGQQSERAMEQVTSTARSALDRVLQDQPLVVAAAGVLAGAALAAAFPATEIEQQTLGPVGQQMGDAARRVGDQVKEAAGAAGDRLKDVADERGLTADGMKKLAKEVTGAFTDSMGAGSPQGSGGSQPGGSGSQQRSSSNPGGPQGPAGPGRPY